MVGGKVAIIESIDYSTNTLTLVEGVEWTTGAGIHYAYQVSPYVGITLPVVTTEGNIDDDPGGGGPKPILPDPGTVLNTNSDFSSDITDWDLVSDGDYVVTYPSDTVVFTGTNSAGYSTQLYQTGLPLIAGETYTIKANISATKGVLCYIGTLNHDNTSTNYRAGNSLRPALRKTFRFNSLPRKLSTIAGCAFTCSTLRTGHRLP